jgi:hypothetical protein
MYSVAIACLFHNGAFFLKEWLEFHLLMGVEHFYLGDHQSTDESSTILEPYIKQGRVDLELVTAGYGSITQFEGKVHLPFYQRIIERFHHTVKWLACIDIDEFITPTVPHGNIGRLLETVVQRHRDKQIGGIVINWQSFGTSNTIIPKGHLITETLIRRAPSSWLGNHTVKSLVRPSYVKSVVSPHYVTYKPGYTSCLCNGMVTDGAFAPTIDLSCLYLRHYSNGDLNYYDQIKSKYLITWILPALIKDRRQSSNEEEEPKANRWFIAELKKRLPVR